MNYPTPPFAHIDDEHCNDVLGCELEHVLGLVDAGIPRHLNTDAALAENWADGRADYALLATLPGSGFHIVGPGVA